ncbi:hypothetical protein GCM10010466_61280 [Planomonospora alba]|uniref:Uncharacterized protein n=1 Tax=Planomonospora alba TaxID=161354 RepID=A0ABP6NYS3_9ACTN
MLIWVPTWLMTSAPNRRVKFRCRNRLGEAIPASWPTQGRGATAFRARRRAPRVLAPRPVSGRVGGEAGVRPSAARRGGVGRPAGTGGQDAAAVSRLRKTQ